MQKKWVSLLPKERSEAICSALGIDTVPYTDLHTVVSDRFLMDEVDIESKKLPRSTLSIVKAWKDDKSIEAPAMPMREGVIYCGWMWYAQSGV